MTTAKKTIQDDSNTTGTEVAKADSKKTRSLAEQLKTRGISPEAWHTLKGSLYPGARDASILLVIDYCKARGLDPLKKPVHIVPMEVYDAAARASTWRDVVLAGIYEHRTTAHRTGAYLGHTAPQFGEPADFYGVEAPTWCSMTFRRLVGDRVAEFPVVVYFSEVCGTKYDKQAKEQRLNARWSRAPRQMLCKCTEAGGLREAFPEELGGQIVEEEVDRTPPVLAEETEPAQSTPAGADAEEMNADLGLSDEDGEARTAADAAHAAAEAPQDMP